LLLSIENVSKSFRTSEGTLQVLNSVSLSLEQSGSVAVTGESGSGKSTLLHMVAGLDTPDSGEINVAGRNVGRLGDGERADLRRNTVGLVFQQFNLIPSLDVSANLEFQARLAGRYDREWMHHLALSLGIEKLLKRYPEQLSGGQQQRVAIGRALAVKPLLLLADEPTGNLDEATGDAVLDLMLSLRAACNTALLLVTHSSRLAARVDRHVHLHGGKLG
jgi:putative ABC transport system ATP-binding protein